MTDFRPHKPPTLEEVSEKILLETFSLRHPLNLNAPIHKVSFGLFLLEGEN